MPNRLKTLLGRAQPAIGTWITLADPYSVELIADSGFDWLLIDAEHIPLGRESLRTILLSMKGSVSTPVVRLSSNMLDHFQTALDLGAQGVVVPMVSSRADTEKAVSHCRYPPLGVRGFAPVRASAYFQNLEEYARQANREISLIVQVETPLAVTNIDQILTTEGIDGIFIGPSDLASFMGLPAQTGHAEVLRVVDTLMHSARAHSIPFGLPTWSPDECLKYVREGGQLLTLGSDLNYLSTGIRTGLGRIRDLLNEDLIAGRAGSISVDGAK
jgi:2-keto-3-deoxy-L-rhamnonate aldolase RhmA